ncbi:hypothetical protein [Stenotrophomonas maltophilia]|uniref:hypothetical protein n=1 Tax=Stenotrophomonas maltophilia TaxID=40324 RepID=UPI001FB9657C|nr:hypothetical protein [Stenotrophomonas maltophilia]
MNEAVHYYGVSRSQFDSNIADYGIEPRNFMGKKLYEKAALYCNLRLQAMVKVTIFWRDGAAYLNWREGGKRSRVAIGRVSPREAEGVRAAKEAELTHGVRILPRLPSVRDFLEPYLEWYKAEHPTTHGKAKSEVRLSMARFGHRPIDTLRPMEWSPIRRTA